MEQITIIGNVGREPIFRTRTDGKEYMMFSMACNTGEKCRWYSVVAPPLKKVAEYITKGKQVLVQGRPTYSIFKDEVDVLVYADRVELLGGKTDAPDLLESVQVPHPEDEQTI